MNRTIESFGPPHTACEDRPRSDLVRADAKDDLVALAGVGATNEDASEYMHGWFVAYIDPGAGSLIIQATIAAVVAVPFYLRRRIARTVRTITRIGVRADATPRGVDPLN